MNEYTHRCIKCTTEYKSTDEDAYYCVTCEEEKKLIAQEVDKKVGANRTVRGKSDLQMYNEIAKTKGVRFVNIKDLGISL